MELPQEIAVWYTIPAVRRELAQRLVKAGLTQRDVAKRLGVTEAAVSQYLSNKRGTVYTYPKEIVSALNAAAQAIHASESPAIARKTIDELCELFKQHKVICELHKKHDKSKSGCTTCYD